MKIYINPTLFCLFCITNTAFADNAYNQRMHNQHMAHVAHHMAMCGRPDYCPTPPAEPEKPRVVLPRDPAGGVWVAYWIGNSNQLSVQFDVFDINRDLPKADMDAKIAQTVKELSGELAWRCTKAHGEGQCKEAFIKVVGYKEKFQYAVASPERAGAIAPATVATAITKTYAKSQAIATCKAHIAEWNKTFGKNYQPKDCQVVQTF